MNPFIESLSRRSSNNSNIVLVDCSSGSEISALELLESSRKMAGKLWAKGVRKDDYVILSLTASPDYYSVMYACFIIGAIPSLVDVSQKKSKLVECVDELKPVLWLSDKAIDGFTTCSLKELVSHPEKKYSEATVSDSTVCLLLYTTGTTGRPKGVPWTIGQLKSQANELNKFHSLIETEFVLFPYLALATIHNGRKAIIPETTSLQPNLMPIRSVLGQMKHYGCDYIFASPAFWERVVEHLKRESECIDFIKIISTAGASLNLNLLTDLKELMADVNIYVPYASTEALLPITLIHYDDFKALSLAKTILGQGIPLGRFCDGIKVDVISPNCQLAVTTSIGKNHIGELVVTGSRVTTEYFRRPDLTKATKVSVVGSRETWHKMGDLGYIDERGMVWFMTRKKYALEMDNGYFCPDAIEQCINIHTGVGSCAVIGNPKERLTVVIPGIEKGTFDTVLLKDMLAGLGYDSTRIIYYPSLLPTDKRHNSKIDRERLNLWLGSIDEFNETEVPV